MPSMSTEKEKIKGGGMREIDLATGKFKELKPLTDALNYRKWDNLAKRVTEHDGEEDEVAEYWWTECAHAEIRMRIPVWGKVKSKQVRVDFKLNWLTVYAPPTEAIKNFYEEDAPPKEPLLDFQLYGAIDVDECIWELVDDGAVRNIIIHMSKRPVYEWPTLHRENGLKAEKDRKPRLEAQKKQWEADHKAMAKAQKDQKVSSFEEAAGPPKPPKFGPEERPERRPHRPKDKDGKPLPPGRPPGSYEGGRIIVAAPPDYTDSSSDDE